MAVWTMRRKNISGGHFFLKVPNGHADRYNNEIETFKGRPYCIWMAAAKIPEQSPTRMNGLDQREGLDANPQPSNT
jgi:hypothetical protein